jgi:copper homeostasis protein
MQMSKLEIACFNFQSAVIAQLGGADRIELCENQHLGGTTPSFELIKQVRKAITIDFRVMIRNRGGNFFYSEEEFEMMKQDIIRFKILDVNGFVFGMLNDKNEIDVERNKVLVQLASPLKCTFHKAFDEVENEIDSLEKIIDCGFDTLLSSGKKQNALNGSQLISDLIKQANNRIIIMPGGGVRSENIFELKNKTKAIFFHSSAIKTDLGIADLEEIKRLKKLISSDE